jgi:thioredoxin-related protein
MKTLILTACALFVATTASLAKTGWGDDYEKSLAKAKEDQKMVLLDFTGSDWCGYCVKLDEEVFSKSAFKKFAKENLVLVELDYPRGKNLPKKTKEQNDGLKSKYGISGYPTIILLDSEGKEAARWVGYKATLLDELKDKVKAPSKEAAK